VIVAAVIVPTAAEQNDENNDNPGASAATKTAKAIITHTCLPPFGLQYIILRRHKTCYKFMVSNLNKIK